MTDPLGEGGPGVTVTIGGGQLHCSCGHVFLGAAETPVHPVDLAALITGHWIHGHGEWVIRCTGIAAGMTAPFAPAGQFLEDYRPEALGGYGSTGWTHDTGRAMHFTSEAAARAAWATPSAVMTARHPAAMYAVEFVPLIVAELSTGPAEPGTDSDHQEG